ncbi:hypothetical protein EDD85DRAFT_834735, partial [Armillaria nabsnona]
MLRNDTFSSPREVPSNLQSGLQSAAFAKDPGLRERNCKLPFSVAPAVRFSVRVGYHEPLNRKVCGNALMVRLSVWDSRRLWCFTCTELCVNVDIHLKITLSSPDIHQETTLSSPEIHTPHAWTLIFILVSYCTGAPSDLMINPVGVTTEEHLVSYFKQTRLIDVVLLASKLNVTLRDRITCGWRLDFESTGIGLQWQHGGLWRSSSKQLSCGTEQMTHADDY